MTNMAIKVVIAEDEALMRSALAQILNREPDIEVAGTAGNGQEAVQLVREHSPDVLLTDLRMPVMDGLSAIQQVKRESPKVEVCVLTVCEDDVSLFEALKLGAKGYLLKNATPDEVTEAVRKVATGGPAIPPALAARVLQEFQRLTRQQSELQELFSELTPREIDILKGIAAGESNKQIARRLFLSEKTVRNHVSNVLLKLEVNTRTEAAIVATRSGLSPE
jgi:DNA-binding NarL/FixJ family response regulator